MHSYGAPQQNLTSNLSGEQYVVVVDGGSTGSRIFVYRYVAARRSQHLLQLHLCCS